MIRTEWIVFVTANDTERRYGKAASEADAHAAVRWFTEQGIAATCRAEVTDIITVIP